MFYDMSMMPMLLGTYATGGGLAGALVYGYRDGTNLMSGRVVPILAVGALSGLALMYVNRNVLGSAGEQKGPIPEDFWVMTGAGAVAGFLGGMAVDRMMGGAL